MKISDGKKRNDEVRGQTDQAVIIDEAPFGVTRVRVGDHVIGEVTNFSIAKKKYDICWRETYEMSATVEAESLEEALKIASKIRDVQSPKLTELDRWEADEEDDDYAYEVCCGPDGACHLCDQALMAQFIEAGRIECLPSSEDEDEALDG